MLQQMDLVDGKVVQNGGAGNIFVYVNPDEQERKHLVETLKLDEHTLASALDPDELARLEFEPDHVAIISKRPRNYSSAESFVFRVASIGLFLFSDRLVLVLSEDAPLFQGKLYSRVSSLQDLLLRIIYSSIFHFVEHLKVINAVSDSLEEQINTSMQNKYLLNLFSLEKSLVYYLNAINSNGKLIERLKNLVGQAGPFGRERRVRRRHDHRKQPVLRPGRDLLEHSRQHDGRPGVDRQQQPQLADEDADDHHHRHHAADAGGEHLFDERGVSGQEPSPGVLGDPGCGAVFGSGRSIRMAVEEMVNNSATRKVVVLNPAGLHARPSLAVSQTVRASKSKVEIHAPRQTVDAAEILQLLSLGATRGTELLLSATGPDAEQVLDTLAHQFADCFGLCDGAE